jgi:hypothetical protein
MAAKFSAIRAELAAAGARAHKAALLRLYIVHRAEFATAGKIEELWAQYGAGLWPLLCQKYTLGDVAPTLPWAPARAFGAVGLAGPLPPGGHTSAGTPWHTRSRMRTK